MISVTVNLPQTDGKKWLSIERFHHPLLIPKLYGPFPFSFDKQDVSFFIDAR